MLSATCPGAGTGANDEEALHAPAFDTTGTSGAPLTGVISSSGRAALALERVGGRWDAFYRANGNRFFKDRHFLVREFPELAAAATVPTRLLEFGCGVGNALLPLVAALPALTVTAFDVSRTAITLAAAALPPADAPRVALFTANAVAGPPGHIVAAAAAAHAAATAAHAAATASSPSTTPGAAAAAAAAAAPRLEDGFHLVLLYFMVSALPHECHQAVFDEAARCLCPGGRLLFRDYADADAAEVRFAPRARVAPRLYERGDGTLAAFLSPADVRRAAAHAGLAVVRIEVVERDITNHAEGATFHRRWLQAVLEAPPLFPPRRPLP